MTRTRVFALAGAMALLSSTFVGSSSLAQYTQPRGQAGFQGGTGDVEKCSLSGVNPADHPDVFGNPAVAKSYGFVQAKDGSWQVMPNCRRR